MFNSKAGSYSQKEIESRESVSDSAFGKKEIFETSGISSFSLFLHGS